MLRGIRQVKGGSTWVDEDSEVGLPGDAALSRHNKE